MKKIRRGHEEISTKLAGKDLLTAMNYLDEGLVEMGLAEIQSSEIQATGILSEEVQATKMQSPKMQTAKTGHGEKGFWRSFAAGKTMKWAATAAIGLCVLGGGIVFAASRLHWSLVDNYGHSGQLGYQVEVVPEQVSVKELTGEVRKVEDIFREEAANGIIPNGDAPRGWVKDFATEKEVVDYIGYERLRESVLDLGETGIDKITLRVLGDKEGNMTLVEYTALQKIPMARELERIDLYTTASIYTDQWPHDFMGTADLAPGDDFQGYDYVTQSGKNALIMYPKEPDGVGGWYPMYAYVVDGGVVYGLQLQHYYWEERDAEYAEELLHQWLEQF